MFASPTFMSVILSDMSFLLVIVITVKQVGSYPGFDVINEVLYSFNAMVYVIQARPSPL